MSTSTNAEISYGIFFEEGFEFPWNEETEWEGDMEEWWLVESGWKWDKQQPYDKDGNYSPGISKGSPLIDEFYDSRDDWRNSHPCPVVEVNYQSDECPAYILAIPESVITARRGYPEVISQDKLESLLEWDTILIEFCDTYGIEHDTGPQWYLTSYWG